MDLERAIRKAGEIISACPKKKKKKKKKKYKVQGGEGCKDKELMIISLVTLNDSVWPRRRSKAR